MRTHVQPREYCRSRRKLTVAVHARLEALGEAARLALVASTDIDNTSTRLLALVVGTGDFCKKKAVALMKRESQTTASNAALEETSTTVTRQHAIMFAGRLVAAHATWLWHFE